MGASSIRVVTVDLDAETPEPKVEHRWHHQPVRQSDGSLRWDWQGILSAIETGLHKALAGAPLASIGVDGWAVDHGILGADKSLLSLPYSYRDGRTKRWTEVADRIGIERLYETTGIQLMGINTIFQLAAHNRAELARASHIFLLPDLVVQRLTGFEGSELSNASTTGLLDLHRRGWSDSLLTEIGVDPSLLPEIATAGTTAGQWNGVPVHLVGSHDTASAFLGMSDATLPGSVFVGTGTWVIVGIERATPDTSKPVMAANFSNESGALGGVRLLRNVMGLWLIERCRRQWGNPPVEVLLAEAEAIEGEVPIFDASDERFLSPGNMEKEILDAAALPEDAGRARVVRSAIESIAAGVASVVSDLESVTAARAKRLALVGGASKSHLVQRSLEARTGLPITLGSPEATALGNAVVQAISLGHFSNLREARDWIDHRAQL